MGRNGTKLKFTIVVNKGKNCVQVELGAHRMNFTELEATRIAKAFEQAASQLNNVAKIDILSIEHQ